MTVSHDEPRWPHKPAIKLMDFHQGRMLLASGHRRADLLTLTDADFERHHGFIQWAFPTPEKSYNNFSPPFSISEQQFGWPKMATVLIFLSG